MYRASSGFVHVLCPDTVLYPFCTVFPTINSIVMIIARALEFEVWYARMNGRSYHSLRRDSDDDMKRRSLLRHVNHKVVAGKEEGLVCISLLFLCTDIYLPMALPSRLCVVSSFSPIRLTQKVVHLRPSLLETPNQIGRASCRERVF